MTTIGTGEAAHRGHEKTGSALHACPQTPGKEFAAEGTLTIAGNPERFVHVLTWSSHSKKAKLAHVLTYRA